MGEKSKDHQLKVKGQQLEATIQKLRSREEELRAANQQLNDEIEKRKKAEKKLQEALLHQNQAVKAGKIGLWDWDLKTNKVHYSKEWKNQIGYEDHEITDDFQEWESRVHPDDLQPTLDEVNASIKEKRTDHKTEFRFKHKDGTYLWILAQASILSDEDGQPARMLGSQIDITERKKTEEVLKEKNKEYEAINEELLQTNEKLSVAKEQAEKSEANVTAIIEGTDHSIWAFDKNYNILYINHVFQNEFFRSFGVKLKPGINLVNALPEPLQPIWKPRYDKVLANEQFRIEDAVPTEVGTIYIEVTFNPIIKDGKVIGGSCFGSDITSRKNAEKALKESEYKLKNIIENSTNLFYAHSVDHQLTFVSPQVHEILGCEPEEAMIHWTDFATDNPMNEKGFQLTRKAIATGKRQPTYELELKRKDDRKIIVEVREAPLVENGKVVSIVGSLADITERKKAEMELQKYKEELEKIIDARTSELIEKNKELERFNSLFVGREFRIKELKNKVKELEKKLNDKG